MSTVMLAREIRTDPLTQRLKKLRPGETITLVDVDGQPLAVLVSVTPMPAPPSLPLSDWQARWESLAQRVSQAWKSKQSALETLAEMRR